MLKHYLIELSLLLDKERYQQNYSQALGRYLTARYGLEAQQWIVAYEQIRADWAAYFVDLNFSGEEGLADMREGAFRVTRALFRLAQAPEPPPSELTQLAHDLLIYAAAQGDSFSEQAHALLKMLESEQVLILTYFPHAQAQAIVVSAGYEQISVIGAETLERYERDTSYFERLLLHFQLEAANCVLLDSHERSRHSAESCGIVSTANLNTLLAKML